MNTYKEYLEMPKVLTMEQMQELHEELVSEIGADEEALELYEDFVKVATEYGQVRAKWKLLSRDEKRAEDDLRTACHDSVIVNINVLSRCLRNQGKLAKWRDVLGDPAEDRYYRKTIGDFACYVVFVNSICAR